MKDTIFSPADILLPDYTQDSPLWKCWSVIACDQHSSEMQYWDSAAGIVGDAPSTLNLILPEAYLETPKADEQKDKIKRTMLDVGTPLRRFDDALIYVERDLPGAGTRRGLLGRLDLEYYDYARDTDSAVRPTEQTVVDRLPPRVKVREKARYELPHTMVFADKFDEVMDFLTDRRAEMEKLYDFELMLGGGHLTGYLVEGEILRQTVKRIADYEASFTNNSMTYAVGDGNHSLAAAKLHYESHKGVPGYESSRWTLCEIVDVRDSAIVFEPIYRTVMTDDVGAFLSALSKICGEGEQRVTCITAEGEQEFSFAAPDHALTVGTLQNFIDRYIADHPETKCDYIHGEDAVRRLGAKPGHIGFIFRGVAKDELFTYVDTNGVLPRKAFSMGDSLSKRYYTEMRQIQKA